MAICKRDAMTKVECKRLSVISELPARGQIGDEISLGVLLDEIVGHARGPYDGLQLGRLGAVKAVGLRAQHIAEAASSLWCGRSMSLRLCRCDGHRAHSHHHGHEGSRGRSDREAE